MTRAAVALVLAVLLAYPAAGAERAGACRTLASMLRAKLGNSLSETPGDIVQTLARNSQGRLVIARWQRTGEGRAALLRAAGVGDLSLDSMASVQTPSSRKHLGAIMELEGSASCMTTRIFRLAGRKLSEIVVPYNVRHAGCKRWGDRIDLGELDGKPVMVTRHGAETINVAELGKKGWEPICGLSLTYATAFTSEGVQCDPGLCAEAERIARQYAIRLKAVGMGDPRYDNAYNSQAAHLLELAANTAQFETDPQSQLFYVVVDGKPTLGQAGLWLGGPAIDSAPVGYTVRLWSDAGDALLLRAAIHLRTRNSVVTKVAVLPHGR